MIYLLYPIPKVVFVPVVLLFLGIGDLAKIVVIFLILFFQIVVLVRDQAAGLAPQLLQSLRSLGAGRRALFRFVYLPASLPAILTALRQSVGTAVAVLYIAELFATRKGLGYYIYYNGSTLLDYPAMYAGVLAMSLLGLGLYFTVDWMERRVVSMEVCGLSKRILERVIRDRDAYNETLSSLKQKCSVCRANACLPLHSPHGAGSLRWIERHGRSCVCASSLSSLFYSLNYRTLKIQLTSETLQLTFGIFTWKIAISNIKNCYLDENTIWRFGGAGHPFHVDQRQIPRFFQLSGAPPCGRNTQKDAGRLYARSLSQPSTLNR